MFLRKKMDFRSRREYGPRPPNRAAEVRPVNTAAVETWHVYAGHKDNNKSHVKQTPTRSILPANNPDTASLTSRNNCAKLHVFRSSSSVVRILQPQEPQPTAVVTSYPFRGPLQIWQFLWEGYIFKPTDTGSQNYAMYQNLFNIDIFITFDKCNNFGPGSPVFYSSLSGQEW